jgi:hypothetical protein
MKGETIMRSFNRVISSILLAPTLGVVVQCTGCVGHAGYYDPYYHDYHPRGGEVAYYSQWEHDTHRDHVDLNKRSKDEQKEYWDWRHSQSGHK